MTEKELREYRDKVRADVKSITGYDDWKDIPKADYGKFIGKRVGNYQILSAMIGKRQTIQKFEARSEVNGKIGKYPVGKMLSGFLFGVGTGGWSRDARNAEQAESINVGDRFGKLTAVTPIFDDNQELTAWYCKCDCGNAINVSVDELVNGKVANCGCQEVIPEAPVSSRRDRFMEILKADEAKTYHAVTICMEDSLYNTVWQLSRKLDIIPRNFVIAATRLALTEFEEKEPIQKEPF